MHSRPVPVGAQRLDHGRGEGAGGHRLEQPPTAALRLPRDAGRVVRRLEQDGIAARDGGAGHAAELAFLLVASADWVSRYRFLALAYCRRSWCHHLVLDFLAVRPGLKFANQPISGMGTGMLFSLTGLAASLDMEMIWGEATASSAPFYEKILQTRPVQDLFIIRREAMRGIREYYFADRRRRLAKINNRRTLSDMKRKLTPKEWLDDLLEYERTHEIAFASPRALLEARLIAEMDKARRPRHRAHRTTAAARPRRDGVAV